MLKIKMGLGLKIFLPVILTVILFISLIIVNRNASKEPVTNIELMNSSILNLVEITNTNTLISEQLPASFEEPHSQVDILKEAISIFKL